MNDLNHHIRQATPKTPRRASRGEFVVTVLVAIVLGFIAGRVSL